MSFCSRCGQSARRVIQLMPPLHLGILISSALGGVSSAQRATVALSLCSDSLKFCFLQQTQIKLRLISFCSFSLSAHLVGLPSCQPGLRLPAQKGPEWRAKVLFVLACGVSPSMQPRPLSAALSYVSISGPCQQPARRTRHESRLVSGGDRCQQGVPPCSSEALCLRLSRLKKRVIWAAGSLSPFHS